MQIQNKRLIKNNTKIILYDMIMPLPIYGIFIIFLMIFNYFWNLIILTIVLSSQNKAKSIGWKHILSINVLITIVGAILDISANIIWFSTQILWLHIASTILLILSLAFFNYFVGKILFKLSRRQAIILGISMGLFTAPWIFIINDFSRLQAIALNDFYHNPQ